MWIERTHDGRQMEVKTTKIDRYDLIRSMGRVTGAIVAVCTDTAVTVA